MNGIDQYAGKSILYYCNLYFGIETHKLYYAISVIYFYRSEQGLEPDLFLLQCCAALAQEDLFVSRILERFGLSNYLSLNLEQSSEYVPPAKWQTYH